MNHLSHVVHAHDLKLVAAAAFVCALSAFTIFSILEHARSAPTRSRGWVALAGLVAGVGIWSTHFIAMLAYDAGTPVVYDGLLTFASFTLAVSITTMGWWLSTQTSRFSSLLPGVIVAAGVFAMHYTGMAAVTLAGSFHWNYSLVVLSFVACAVLSVWAIGEHRRKCVLVPWRPALLFVVAICSLHFIAMEAITVSIDHRLAVADELLDPNSLAALVTAASLVIVAVGFFVVLVDRVHDREKAAAKIAHLAFHDVLTGLPNRSMLEDHLACGVEEAGSSNQPLAVICVDLDGFKAVNDTHGHAAGDELLVHVATRLRSVTRERELVARVGGDEFIIVQQGGLQPCDAGRTAERVVAVIKEPFSVMGKSIQIGASVGIAVFPKDARTAEELAIKADAALYRAKAAGRGGVRFYDTAIGDGIMKRRAIEAALPAAVRDGRFDLHYQPIGDLRSGGIIGFEALLRWSDPELGTVDPQAFVAVAEETALIDELGAWVLETSCREAVLWKQPIKLCVNFSPMQFLQCDLTGTVSSILHKTGLDPKRLEIEVTENVLLTQPEQAICMFNDLKALGVQLSLDDFGTGYSSLSYFRVFPFDKVKIDRSFTADIARPAAREIIRSVVSLGRNLGITVVAEGVETDEQLNMLRDLGCEQVQGYLIGAPSPAAHLRARLGTASAVKSQAA